MAVAVSHQPAFQALAEMLDLPLVCSDWFDSHAMRFQPNSIRWAHRTGILCQISYCNRHRNSARSQNIPEFSKGNAGFRTANRLDAWRDSEISVPARDSARSAVDSSERASIPRLDPNGAGPPPGAESRWRYYDLISSLSFGSQRRLSWSGSA